MILKLSLFQKMFFEKPEPYYIVPVFNNYQMSDCTFAFVFLLYMFILLEIKGLEIKACVMNIILKAQTPLPKGPAFFTLSYGN